MALGVDYAQQDCSLARALEVVGERWTILILRDAFFGVRRFTDFQNHLDISKATLTDRLTGLIESGLLIRTPRGGRDEYTMTPSGLALWPALFALTQWGESQSPGDGPRRIFSHSVCGAVLVAGGVCPSCGTAPAPADVKMRPGPGMTKLRADDVSKTLRTARRLLDPVRP